MIGSGAVIILALFPYATCPSVFISPLFIIQIPSLNFISFFISYHFLPFFVTPPSLAIAPSIELIFLHVILILFSIFGQIILIPLGLLSPLFNIAAGFLYYYSTIS